MTSPKVDILWSPTESNRFITVGTDIQLFEVEYHKDGILKSFFPLSETSSANLIASSSDHQYLKCFAWCTNSDYPLVLAIGSSNGHITLESIEPTSKDVELIGREFVPKIIRACSVLSWNPIETNILLSGFDKSRGDNGIYLWDVTRSLYSSSTIDAVTNYDRRSVFSAYDSTNTTVKPVLELGLSENACSAYWFHKNPHIFVCGMSGKFLKLYDTRDSSKHPESTLTRATFNLCGDPEVEHRLASSFDCNFLLWDVRNFEKPFGLTVSPISQLLLIAYQDAKLLSNVVTITRPKPIVKLAWSPTRSGLLAVLCKDSSSINLYDIQSPIGNDEVEPALVERIIQPFPSHSALSFAWHPTHENRMLGISQNNQLIDYKISDRITLNWSPTSEIVWTHGKKILQCVDSRDEFYLCLNDISVKMRKRASQGYGLKMQKVRSNAEFADDPNLTGVWMWLDLVKTYEVDTKKRHQKQPKYEGVYSVICGENDSSAFSQSEPRRVSWVGINSDCRIIKYTCEERERALQLCGWGADLDSVALYKFLERLENDGHYARAAAIAVFNLEIRRGIKILSKGALSRSHKSSCDLNAIAMALAGYTEERSGLWREVSGALKSQLTDSYLRAMFAFLTADNDAYEEILKDNKIVVQDRMAFACLYLNDKKLAEFLDGLRSRMTETGNLDGLLLTGLTNDGLFLIQRYVDTTGDVQTASLIILHTLPSQVCRDPRAQSWVENYRQLLDTWMLWTHRAMFDVNWYNKNTQISKPTQQIFVSCNFCRRSVSNFLQLRPISGSNRVPASSANRKITCCPGCRKPLPRCSLCLCHMGTAAGLPMQRQAENEERKKMTDFSNWLTWCQTCRHGGHSAHILEWFRNHNECPVTGCMCKCMSLDATGKHVTEVY